MFGRVGECSVEGNSGNLLSADVLYANTEATKVSGRSELQESEWAAGRRGAGLRKNRKRKNGSCKNQGKNPTALHRIQSSLSNLWVIISRQKPEGKRRLREEEAA
jgi:hypothetical protein